MHLAARLAVFSICWQAVGAVAAPSAADQVIEGYIVAIGGYERIKALDNLVYSGGTYEEGDYRSAGDSTMSRARPWYKLVGSKDRPGAYMEGYDGSAWEWFADPGVVVRTVGAASAASRHYAGVEGPLVDYRAKGSRATLEGEVTLDGAQVWVVVLTRRDGFVEQFYIDQASSLIVASGGAAPIHAFGEEVTSLTRIGDYRPVAGVLVAHRFTTVEMPSGKALSAMQWGRIEGNVDLPDDWFSPPHFVRSPMQRLIEDLYRQRSDLNAVMWTYEEFRRANPPVNTAAALDFVGYQTLKMGEVENAIALLERNVADYPRSANAQFGLGRAYATAGRMGSARGAYRAALEIDPSHERAGKALAELPR